MEVQINIHNQANSKEAIAVTEQSTAATLDAGSAPNEIIDTTVAAIATSEFNINAGVANIDSILSEINTLGATQFRNGEEYLNAGAAPEN